VEIEIFPKTVIIFEKTVIQISKNFEESGVTPESNKIAENRRAQRKLHPQHNAKIFRPKRVCAKKRRPTSANNNKQTNNKDSFPNEQCTRKKKCKLK
jgi:hypothetical protein